jgi:hypothetical protein
MQIVQIEIVMVRWNWIRRDYFNSNTAFELLRKIEDFKVRNRSIAFELPMRLSCQSMHANVVLKEWRIFSEINLE